jgi:hypothetical protein
MVLPAIMKLAEKALFKQERSPVSASCNCGFCIIISAATALLIAINLYQNWHVRLDKLTWMSIVAIVIMALICGIMSRRRACERRTEKVSGGE